MPDILITLGVLILGLVPALAIYWRERGRRVKAERELRLWQESAPTVPKFSARRHDWRERVGGLSK